MLHTNFSHEILVLECLQDLPIFSDRDKQFYSLVFPIVCSFGVIANFFVVLILGDSRFTSPVYLHLRLIALLHLIGLVVIGINSFFWASNAASIWTQMFALFVHWPVSVLASSISLAVLTAATIYWCIAIHSEATNRCSKHDRALSFRLNCLTFILILIVSLPRIASFKMDWNSSCLIYRWQSVEVADYSYITYSALHIVFFQIGHVCILFFGACRFLKRFRDTSNSRLNRLTLIAPYTYTEGPSQSRTVTASLISMNLLFCVTQIPISLLDSSTTFLTDNFYNLSGARKFKTTHDIACVLMAIQFGGSFIVYVLFNELFRKIMASKVFISFSENYTQPTRSIYFKNQARDINRKNFKFEKLTQL